MSLNPLSNDPNHWQMFVRKCCDIINQRSADVIARENWYQRLPAVCQSRNPQQLTRQELSEIIIWKHTDPRWRIKPIHGLDNLSDKEISDITIIALSDHIPLEYKLRKLMNVHGWGIATVSAILTAGRPDLYGVIDRNVLNFLAKTIEEWRKIIKFDRNGDATPTKDIYYDFLDWIRIKSSSLSEGSPKKWSPREVEMALWAAGAQMPKSDKDSESTLTKKDIGMGVSEIGSTHKYIERLITTHKDRRKPKGIEALTDKQKTLYDTIKAITEKNPKLPLTNKQITEKYQIRHGALSLLPTDFCYNLVNVGPDFETKFLIGSGRGEFEFVGFHWQAKDREEKIRWTPKGKDVPKELKGKTFTVGIYRKGEYSWNFSELDEYL
jgi:hypothetical protein